MEREEKIQAYLNGSMNEKDRTDFEKELTTNKALQQEVGEYKNIQASIAHAEKLELKNRLKQIDLQEKTTPSKKTLMRRLRPFYIPVAAASILLIVLFNIDILLPTASNEALYKNYFTTYPNTLQPVQRGSTGSNPEMKAFVAYESGDFEQAALLFKNVLDQKTDPDIKFYYSMSLLNSGKSKVALPVLNALKKDSTLYIPQTYWYAALIELKNGNRLRSKQLIDSLQLLDSDFKTEDALQLKKELE